MAAYNEPYTLYLVVPLTVTYVVIFVAGILGNTSTCVVIVSNRSMHTTTNFYLFSLAISDLIILVCGLPLEVYRLWNPFTYPLGEALCIAIGLASETSTNATVLTITAFTVERYIAICRPFMSHTMSKLSRVVRFIIAIWVLALCTAVPQVMQLGIVSHKSIRQNVSMCTVKGVGVQQVFVISSFVFFVVPMLMISVLYALIGIELRTSGVSHPMNKISVDRSEKTSQRRVIRMLVAVALSFFICWAPFHVQRLLAIYGKSSAHTSNTYYWVYMVLTILSGVLLFLSTAINPFLYNIMSSKFRNAFKDVAVRINNRFAKTKLKGSNITISQLLTRHQIFMTMREKFGVTKLWTKRSQIYVVDCDGNRQVNSLCNINKYRQTDELKMASVAAPAAVQSSPRSKTTKHAAALKK